MNSWSTADPWISSAKGVQLKIRLAPNASANRVIGIEVAGDGGCRLKIGVTAVPEKGKANKALIKVLSKLLSMPPRDFSLIAGVTDRNKTLLIDGDADTVIGELKKRFATIG